MWPVVPVGQGAGTLDDRLRVRTGTASWALERARATPIYIVVTSILLFAIIALFVLPLVASTVLHFARERIIDWRNADRSSVGLLPSALPQSQAVVRIFSA
jgi:hypothetical protein